MSQENIEKVKKAYEAFGRGDIPAVVADYAPDMEWHSPKGTPGIGGVHRGPQAIVEGVFIPMSQLWENMTLNIQEYIDAGDRVIALGTLRATARETGKSDEMAIVHITTFRDGKMVKFEDYGDTAAGRDLLAK